MRKLLSGGSSNTFEHIVSEHVSEMIILEAPPGHDMVIDTLKDHNNSNSEDQDLDFQLPNPPVMISSCDPAIANYLKGKIY